MAPDPDINPEEEYAHSPEIQAVQMNKDDLHEKLRPVTRFLLEYHGLSKTDIKEIKEREKESLDHASGLFLTKLVTRADFWEDFIDALKEDGKEDLADKLLQDYQRILNEEKEQAIFPDPEETPDPEKADGQSDGANADEGINTEPMDETDTPSTSMQSPHHAQGEDDVVAQIDDFLGEYKNEGKLDVKKPEVKKVAVENNSRSNDAMDDTDTTPMQRNFTNDLSKTTPKGNEDPKRKTTSNSINRANFNITESEAGKNNASCSGNIERERKPAEREDNNLKDDGSQVQEDHLIGVPPPKKQKLEEKTMDKLAENFDKMIRISPKSMEARGYQRELAERPAKGVNCMICAPTGCGKTFIAIMIAEEHIRKGLPVTKLDGSSEKLKTISPERRRRVLFVEPTIVLVQQTYKVLRQVQPMWTVCRKSSSHHLHSDLSVLQRGYQVIVATAGAVANALKLEEVSISDFTMLLFDECHHALGDSSYCQILNHHLKAKQTNPDNIPQIIGFTASPNVGKKTDLASVQAKLLRQCAHLCGEEFITVRREDNVRELEEKVNIPTRSTEFAEGRSNDNPMMRKLTDIMDQLHKDGLSVSCPVEMGSQEYMGWLNQLNKEYHESMGKRKMRYCDHLKEYNTALTRVKQARMIDGFEVLQEYYDSISDLDVEPDKKLMQLFKNEQEVMSAICEQEAEFPNPKLVHVIRVLKNQEKPFKGMALVKEKYLAYSLAKYIAEQLPELNPEAITGETEGGMTSSKREAIIDKFRSGECSMLVATSVAEEGLDIPECRLMINYDYCGGLTSITQAKGRVRAKDGKHIVIGGVDTLSKLNKNLRLELVRTEVIRNIQHLPKAKYAQIMENNQKQILRKLHSDEQEAQNRKWKDSASDIRLVCVTCHVYLCAGSDLRVYDQSHRIVWDDTEAFRKRINLETNDDKHSVVHGLTHKVLCRKCNNSVANLLNQQGEEFFAIRAKGILQQIGTSYSKISKWGKATFNIPAYELF